MRNASVEKGHVLAEGVVVYIVENIDDFEQESHWRAKFGRKVSDISKELKALKEDNKELKQDIARRHEEMMKLLMALKPASTA